MLKLHVILASVRPGRAGQSIASWFVGIAGKDDRFETTLVDLADHPLPMDAEPHHPRLGKYEQAGTRRWSETIAAADAFVIVTPEYNHSFPASLKNALDHLSGEWNRKPVGFVSYGGISGGLRAVQALKPVVGILGMIAVNEGVVAPLFAAQREGDAFRGTEQQGAGAAEMLDSLADWAPRLKAMRG